jgi:hypothetical protein
MKFEDAPRLSRLPFLLGNLALLALAWFVYSHHPNPFSPLPLFIIFVCFLVGILTSIYPYVVNNLRDQADSAISLRHELDEQFKRLVAASEHLQNSVIQLKSIDGIVTNHMESAKSLPPFLQERIGEFRQQLAVSENKDKARLEEELTRLRSAESERQTTAANQISNALAEWTRLEADARRSLTEMVQREKELFAQQVVTLRSAEDERLAAAAEEITSALTSWTEIEAGVRRQLAAATELQEKLGGVLSALDGRIADLQAAVGSAVKAAQTIPPAASVPPAIVLQSPAAAEEEPLMAEASQSESMAAFDRTPESVEAAGANDPDPTVLEAIVPPAPLEPPAAAETTPDIIAADPLVSISVPEIELPPAPSEPPAAIEATEVVVIGDEPKPALTPEVVVQSEPLPAVEPAPEAPAAMPSIEPSDTIVDETVPPTPLADASATVAPAKPRKPRAPRKPKLEAIASALIATEPVATPAPATESPIAPSTSFELIAEPVSDESPSPEDFSQVSPDENKPVANASTDGQTRLTVVSYIGIGNKLHIRGEGAGLSWSKGVPLQFVSIGRWRWETDKATEPVTCRIYKNDKLEAGIGPLMLLPGTEQEVSATF